jgi:hypothetical protein
VGHTVSVETSPFSHCGAKVVIVHTKMHVYGCIPLKIYLHTLQSVFSLQAAVYQDLP